MSGFVCKPNLPDGNVNTVIAGQECAQKFGDELSQLGIRVLPCPKNPHVDPRLASHADLSVFHMGENRFLLASYLKSSQLEKSLCDLGAEILFSECRQSSVYPADAGLCALSVGDMVFHNQKLSAPEILSSSTHFTDVRQGYAKCAVCVVSESASISADIGMARAMRQKGIDVLNIRAGFVSLAGFNEGFIGGSCFKFSSDKLVFLGNIPRHPDFFKISSFLARNRVDIICLKADDIFDMGSVIPVYEA